MPMLKRLILKTIIVISVMIGIFAFQFNSAFSKIDDTNNINTEKKELRLLVKYKNESKVDALKSLVKRKLKLSKFDTVKKYTKQRIDELELGKKEDINKVIQELKNNPDVEYVQPNYKLTICTVPEDQMFGEQWGLSNTGQDIEGQTARAGVDIKALQAWDITAGSSAVAIGIMDTGIDINHEDLSDRIYVNTGEIPGNGIDDDGNGYIDDVNGWDFANGDNTVYDSGTLDLHGTYVAGIVAASANNKGIRGVAPGVKILPLKFINGNSGYTCDAISAIEYAMNMGIKIINCSFSGSDNNHALKDAMQNSGILFMCAAGNYGTDVSSTPMYPACFDIPNVISVAAMDGNGKLAAFSSYGDRIRVAAPGINVLSTIPDNKYDYFTGTSVSAPFVTGIAALLKSHEPNLTNLDIADRIINNVAICASLQGKVSTGGRVDAYAALTNTPPQQDNYTGPGWDTGTVPPGEPTTGDNLWYTMDQFAKIKERIHYGESGVNPATGNFSFSCTDMTVSSPGFRIDISRTYNSKDDKSTPMGRGWTFGFEGSVSGTNLVTASLPDGSVRTFRKNSNGTYTAEDSRSTFVKNQDGTYTLTARDRYSYGYNANGWLCWMKDRQGNIVTIQVDSNGKVTGIIDGAGRNYTVSYNSQGLIESITDPANRVVRYEYDADKRLIRAIDPMNNIMRYSYDSWGFINEIRDHNSALIESIIYNHAEGPNQHKASQATDAIGDSCIYTYDTVNRKTAVTENNNAKQWVYWYDDAMYIIKVQDPEGRFSITEYFKDDGKNKFGEVMSATDRNGNTTQYQRDTQGNTTRVTNPDMSFREYTYDDKNNLIMEKDETGRCIFYIYDSEKINLIKKAQPLNGIDVYNTGCNESLFAVTIYTYYTETERQQLGYNAKGLLKSVTDPLGNVTAYTYDADGNTKTITDPESKVITHNYNNIGWKTSTISPTQYRTDYVYDRNGLLEKMTLHSGETTRITYDAMGRKIKEISPNLYNSSLDDITNHVYSGDNGYRYVYYNSGKLQTVTDPENNTTSYVYDVYGNIISETKPNNSIYRYEYDVMDRLKKVYFKEDQAAEPILLEEYSYSILTSKNTQKTHTMYINDTEKIVTSYIYDYADRLIEQQNPNGTRIVTVYNPNGTVSSTKDANGSITCYKYNGLNKLAQQWTPLEIANGIIMYSYTGIEYDKAGRKTAEKTGKEKTALNGVPSAFITRSYEYYPNGWLKAVTDSAGRKTSYEYDNSGSITKEEVYTDIANKNTTEYINNHLGKVVEKKLHARAGDIFGNDFSNTADSILSTAYTYDNDGNLKTVTTPDGVATTYTYDNMDRQTGTSQPGQDENANPVTITTSITYNWEGKPLTKVDSNGNSTTFTYNMRGFLEKTADAAGGVNEYYYDWLGRKIAEVTSKNYDSQKTLEQMNRIEYTYDPMGMVKTRTDKYVDPVTSQWISSTKAYKYDGNGNLLKELDPSGYDAGTGSSVEDRINTGYGTEYTYNPANKVVTVLDTVSKERALPYTTKYEYDGAMRKTTETNANGVVTVYCYDDAGNITSVKVKKTANSPEQTMKTSTYDLAGSIRTQTDGNGNTTTYEYNIFNKARSAVYPGDSSIPSNTVTYQYDVLGNLKKQQDATGRVDLYIYDNQGRMLSHTRQKSDETQSVTTSARYDRGGNKRFETDGNNTTAENTYDALNRMISTKINVSGILRTTTYTYDANGNQITKTDWRNNTYTNVYDPINRLIEKKDPYNITIQRLDYNKNNMQVKSYDALNNLTEYIYDRNNRLLITIDPAGHMKSQTYDNVGNIRTRTDGRNITTTYNYDEFNRLKSTVNAKLETASYTYDLNGDMLGQTDGKGNVTTFEYNAVNKLLRRTDHGGRTGSPTNYIYIAAKTESYSYYADGNLYTKTDRNGNITTYTYDVHGRISIQTAGTLSITYTYDNNGNQLTVTDSTGTTTRTYDEMNRVLAKTVPDIGQTVFAYDIISGVPEGNTCETSTDPRGNVATRIYDRAGRLYSVTANNQTTTYDYYDNGSRQSVTYPDGSREDYTYYSDNLLWTLTNKKPDGSILDTYSYTYDSAHNQLSKVDTKGTTAYTYDSLNRLEKVVEPNGRTTAYTFDAAGNRITETVTQESSTAVTSYAYDSQNRLTGTVATTAAGTTEKVHYTYDNNGNMICRDRVVIKPTAEGDEPGFILAKAGTTGGNEASFFEYDMLNQLTKSTTGDKTITYTYSGDGLRAAKTVNGQTTKYLYEYDKVVLELDGTGNQTARNVYGTNLLLRQSGDDTAYYMYNGHGDVTALLGTAGQVLATYYYDAFGNPEETTGTISNPFRYAGYFYDGETGLYYLNARYYDPDMARFITEDTYRGDPNDPLSLNLYTYCHNEPVMYTDPDGHFRETYEPLDQYINENSDEWKKIVAAKKAWNDYNKKIKEEADKYAKSVERSYGEYLKKYNELAGLINEQQTIWENARKHYELKDPVYYGKKYNLTVEEAKRVLEQKSSKTNDQNSFMIKCLINEEYAKKVDIDLTTNWEWEGLKYGFIQQALDVANIFINEQNKGIAYPQRKIPLLQEEHKEPLFENNKLTFNQNTLAGRVGFEGVLFYTTMAVSEAVNAGLKSLQMTKLVTEDSLSTVSTTRVGRWMSQAEYDTMVKTGKVPESFTGTTHVASPADINAFGKQAKPGSIYVEFDVPSSSLKPTNEGWSKIVGPNSLEGRLATKKGQPIPEMPSATNIEIKGNK